MLNAWHAATQICKTSHACLSGERWNLLIFQRCVVRVRFGKLHENAAKHLTIKCTKYTIIKKALG